MKITDFKEGDLITRTKKTREYCSEPDHVGDCLMFCEVSNKQIYLMIIYGECSEKYFLTVIALDEAIYNDNSWNYYKSPVILNGKLVSVVENGIMNAVNNGDKYKCRLFEKAIKQLNGIASRSI